MLGHTCACTSFLFMCSSLTHVLGLRCWDVSLLWRRDGEYHIVSHMVNQFSLIRKVQ